MKNFLVTLAFITLFATSAFSQWGLHSTNTEHLLFAVHFTSETTGFAAGFTATFPSVANILKTTNGGNSWTSAYNAGEGDIRDLYFLNSNFGAGAGYNDAGDEVVFITTNGGTSWVEHDAGQPTPNAVHFTDENTGYIVGGLAYEGARKTTDGGQTWSTMTMPAQGNEDYYMHRIQFTSAATGYIVAEFDGGDGGAVYKTSNAGASWEIVLTVSNPGSTLTELHFFDDQHGIAAGEKAVFYTSNGGISWSEGTTPLGSELDSRGVFMISPTKGFLIHISDIYSTVDGGATWQLNDEFGLPVFSFEGMYFPSEQVGYAVGGPGLFIKTTNGGGILSATNELSLENELKIAPNPASESTSVDANGATELNLIDIHGHIMHVENQLQNGQFIIKKGSLPTGFYLMTLKDSQGNIVGKGKLIFN